VGLKLEAGCGANDSPDRPTAQAVRNAQGWITQGAHLHHVDPFPLLIRATVAVAQQTFGYDLIAYRYSQTHE
jgi:hypothetical protein